MIYPDKLRRKEHIKQFYPGGDFETWSAEWRDLNRGIPAVHPKVEVGTDDTRVQEFADATVKATVKRRNSFANLLTIFASFAPPETLFSCFSTLISINS